MVVFCYLVLCLSLPTSIVRKSSELYWIAMARPGHGTRCPGTLSRDYETRRPGTQIAKSQDSLETLEKIFSARVRSHKSVLLGKTFLDLHAN